MRGTVRSLLVAMTLLNSSASAWADARTNYVPVGDVTVLAQDDRVRGRGRGGRERDGDLREDRVIPLDAIINTLMASYPGKPLDARGPMQRRGLLVYEIVWLTQDSRQIVIIVNAQTGQVLYVRGLG